MAVLGASPALSYVPIAAQSFNGNSSQTIFTLNNSVGATTDIEVLVDNVQQSPYDGSYSVAGTTLTFSEAPSTGTNNIYVVYRIVRGAVQGKQVIPDDGSVTSAKLADSSVTSSKLSGALTTPGNLTVSGTAEIVGGADGAALTLKNGGDLRLQNLLNDGAVHIFCDANGIAKVDGKFASTALSQNYAYGSFNTGTTVNTTTPTIIASCTLTTTGKPVLLMASGDANHASAGTWQYTQFAVDGIAIGKYIINVGSGASYNNPFGLVHIHQPPAGTWTFQVRAWQGSGSVTWGEDGNPNAPVIIAMEIL